MIEFRNPFSVRPPGSLVEILSHPFRENDSMELAIFQEHRYAFFYWLKWTRNLKLKSPPCLVSLDWHQDLCFPCDTEKEWLEKLDQSNNGEIAVFSWAKLAGNNDGQILSAAHLNLIGNIYVLCRQEDFGESWEDEKFIDFQGNTHSIKKFKTIEQLEKHLIMSKEQHVYFDIDLDYFTINNPLNGAGEEFSYMKENEIIALLLPEKPLIKWIFERLEGFTIATEPEHCGGLLKSNKLLDIINKVYFKPDLFTNESDWKHR